MIKFTWKGKPFNKRSKVQFLTVYLNSGMSVLSIIELLNALLRLKWSAIGRGNLWSGVPVASGVLEFWVCAVLTFYFSLATYFLLVYWK